MRLRPNTIVNSHIFTTPVIYGSNSHADNLEEGDVSNSNIYYQFYGPRTSILVEQDNDIANRTVCWIESGNLNCEIPILTVLTSQTTEYPFDGSQSTMTQVGLSSVPGVTDTSSGVARQYFSGGCDAVTYPPPAISYSCIQIADPAIVQSVYGLFFLPQSLGTFGPNSI